jgi:integrase
MAGLASPATNQTESASKCQIATYEWQMQKNGMTDSTREAYTHKLLQLVKLCNILNPEEVKVTIALGKQTNGTKSETVNAYNSFFKYKQIQWEKPHYKRKETLPFIPQEVEIDQLIATVSKRLSAFLQILKETGARTIEASTLQWKDIDTERKVLTINNPAKGSNPRTLPISTRLIEMVNAIPKENQRIFNTTTREIRCSFARRRKVIAQRLKNPRLSSIHLHTFRHWKGTMEYHKTHDIYHVKLVLGHKSVKNTEIYITIENSLFTPENSEYHTATATTIQEIQKLLEAGFEYITELDRTKIFRKRK